MKLSVVLGVYNDASHIGATIESVLAQTEPDFELIVVDDGSNDATSEIVARYRSHDSRIRIITQPNAGLTSALIRGCAEARATVIARHDSGDLSHPERFRKQFELLQGDVVLVACGTAFVGPELEPLHVTHVDGENVRQSLLHDDATRIHGIAGHGSAMFRREAYERVGGYREQFYYAQDLDLWVRLATVGRIVAVPEVMFTVRVEPQSISSTHRDRQVLLKGLIVQLRDGGPQEELLASAWAVRGGSGRQPRRARAAGFYFIGRGLRRSGDLRARQYFIQALGHDPFHLRAWLSLLSGR